MPHPHPAFQPAFLDGTTTPQAHNRGGRCVAFTPPAAVTKDFLFEDERNRMPACTKKKRKQNLHQAKGTK